LPRILVPGEVDSLVAAERLATMWMRIASTWPSRPFKDPLARPDKGGAGGADGVEGIGFPLLAPGAAIGPVDLDHGDTDA
jgi:hypothetical protein